MRKLIASTTKEIWLLLRDWGGLAILFFMPVILLITITVIQESTFRAVGEAKLPVLFVDEDQGALSQKIQHAALQNPGIQLINKYNDQPLDRERSRELVSSGEFQIAIIIPKGLSQELEQKVSFNVEKILEQFTISEGTSDTENENIVHDKPKRSLFENKYIDIYFDPAAGQSFRASIKNSIDKIVANIETEKIYEHFQEQMGVESISDLLGEEILSFRETIAQKGNDGIIPNAVQHNVPAWILFGIFFIVVPLGINIVKEKNLGTYIRLRTSPVSFATILGGKIITYCLICLIQFFLMLLVANSVFPLVGLIPFIAGNQIGLLTIIAFISGLAAVGLGLLIGTIAYTQEQSAPFGAIFVIILAALGGVWVPTFIMPPFMQQVSTLSPMNWGLNAFYDVILRNGALTDISGYLLLLFSFFVLSTGLAVFFDRYKRLR